MKLNKTKRMKLRGINNFNFWLLKQKKLMVLVFLMLFGFSSVYYFGFDQANIKVAQAATCTIAASTNWSALTCGTGGGQPTSADTVNISGAGTTLTVDVANAVANDIT
ncbi:MAG: hypothetical protein NTZ49_00490, partial [Candidatus Parcubacteria bacterium]|nr:hypothetical protein [Candidatus Parcubacteria bacterium]